MLYRKPAALWLVCIVLAMAGSASAQDASRMPFQSPEPDKSAAAPLRAGANSFAESQARKLLEAKGYAEVSSLVNDKDGIWRGTAIKDDRKVNVSVDFQGHVAAQ